MYVEYFSEIEIVKEVEIHLFVDGDMKNIKYEFLYRQICAVNRKKKNVCTNKRMLFKNKKTKDKCTLITTMIN